MSEPANLHEGMEANRRALLSLYRTRSVEYSALAVILAIAIIGELILLGVASFPQFLVYPLLLVTAISTLFLIYSVVFWWRMVGYVVSMPISSMKGDTMVALHEAYINRARESTPTFILPGGRRLDALIIVVATLILFLVSLPLSYYVTGLHAGITVGLLATVIFLFAVGLVVLAIYLIARSEKASASRQIEKILTTLRQYGDEFRFTASVSSQGVESAPQRSISVLMRDLTNRIMAEVESIGAFMAWITPDQKKALADAVTSISSGMIALNLQSDAGRVYQAYRKVVPA